MLTQPLRPSKKNIQVVTDASATITRKLVIMASASTGRTLTLPNVKSKVGEVWFMNQSNQTITVAAATGKLYYGTTAKGNSHTVATGKTSHYMSDGVYWYCLDAAS